jgi:hypothetical protein
VIEASIALCSVSLWLVSVNVQSAYALNILYIYIWVPISFDVMREHIMSDWIPWDLYMSVSAWKSLALPVGGVVAVDRSSTRNGMLNGSLCRVTGHSPVSEVYQRYTAGYPSVRLILTLKRCIKD